MRRIQGLAVDSPHKGQWRGALVFSLICGWSYGRADNRDPGDLSNRARYDATVMKCLLLFLEVSYQLCGPKFDKVYGPLARYVKLRVAHAPRTPETFSPPPTWKETASQQSRDASRHVRHARAVMHVGIANPRWRGKRSRHSRRMRNPQCYVFSKWPTICLALSSVVNP